MRSEVSLRVACDLETTGKQDAWPRQKPVLGGNGNQAGPSSPAWISQHACKERLTQGRRVADLRGQPPRGPGLHLHP